MSYRMIDACLGKPVDRTPVWLMRQAGRYMKEYREIRKKVSFLDLCKNPDLCAEVTLQPIKAFGLDAAILFSDILVPLEPMGLELDFDPAPVFSSPVRTKADVDKLKPVNPAEEVPFVMDAVKAIRKAIEPYNIPLIGFSGAPFTLASYIVEGGGSKSFAHLKSLMYQDRTVYNALMEKLSIVTANYLNGQIESGAQIIQIFDTWAGILTRSDYREYVLPYIQLVIESLNREEVPVIYFVGNGSHLLDITKEVNSDVVGLDWRIDIDKAREILGKGVPVQGNLDPTYLFAPADQIKAKVTEILDKNGSRPGHIFNLGHGILPQTPVENVKALVETVQEYRTKAV